MWGGKFEFPNNNQLVSGVCHISISSLFQLNKPVTVQLEHCVHITDEKQAKCLSFVVAKSGPPFKFEYLPGGSFCPGSQYGTIHLKEFSYIAIVLCPLVGIATLSEERPILRGVYIGGILGCIVGTLVVQPINGLIIRSAIGAAIELYYATSKSLFISYTCMK